MSNAAYDKKHKCPSCGKEFWAARRTAIYCSPRCRQRAHRKPTPAAALKEHYDQAHSAINAIAFFADRKDFEGYRAQQQLKALIMQALEYANDATRKKIFEDLKDLSVTW